MPDDGGLFNAIFGREPKKQSTEPNFDRTVRALRLALDNTTPERPGVVWDSPKKQDEEEAPKAI
jgi:hypothetical protein